MTFEQAQEMLLLGHAAISWLRMIVIGLGLLVFVAGVAIERLRND